jgi:hypothetical protein
MSSISDNMGSNQEILRQMEKMTTMLAKLTHLIPNTPGNHSELPNSQSAGSSGESAAPSSSSGTGALPR